jgi:hypothetical protein
LEISAGCIPHGEGSACIVLERITGELEDKNFVMVYVQYIDSKVYR